MKKLKAKYRDSEAEKKVNRIDAALNRFYLSMEKQPLTKWEQGANEGGQRPDFLIIDDPQTKKAAKK